MQLAHPSVRVGDGGVGDGGAGGAGGDDVFALLTIWVLCDELTFDDDDDQQLLDC